MSYKIACFTLFDITYTGVLNRAKPTENENVDEWSYRRNTQCNLDTILQAISLRSQPEILSNPKKYTMKSKKVDGFGSLFQNEKKDIPYWEFEFVVQHPSVFEDGISDLGHLYNDCHGIPMMKCSTEYDKLPKWLDTTSELRNIFFVKYGNEQ